MVGIELVTDRKDKTPAKAETAVLFEHLRGKQHSKPRHSHFNLRISWLTKILLFLCL